MNPFQQMAALLNAHFGLKLDAAQTMAFARELELIDKTVYETKYPEHKARALFPPATVPAGVQSLTYRMWDFYGMAKVVANFASDIPMVGASGKEFTSKVKTLADGFLYSIEDLQAAAFTGMPLDATLGTAARRAMEAGIDAVAAFGIPESGMPGFLNHPNIPLVAPTTGDMMGAATAAQVLADLSKLVTSIVTLTKGAHAPDTLLLPLGLYEHLAGFRLGDAVETTVLRAFLNTNPHIKNIDAWNQLDTAGADGNGRIVAYSRNKEVLDFVMSKEFTQLPPQAVNLAFKIPCLAQTGGVRIRYPLAIAFMDGAE